VAYLLTQAKFVQVGDLIVAIGDQQSATPLPAVLQVDGGNGASSQIRIIVDPEFSTNAISDFSLDGTPAPPTFILYLPPECNVLVDRGGA